MHGVLRFRQLHLLSDPSYIKSTLKYSLCYPSCPWEALELELSIFVQIGIGTEWIRLCHLYDWPASLAFSWASAVDGSYHRMRGHGMTGVLGSDCCQFVLTKTGDCLVNGAEGTQEELSLWHLWIDQAPFSPASRCWRLTPHTWFLQGWTLLASSEHLM